MPQLSKVGSVMLNGALPALDASSLTSIPAANITGTLPAISGTNLTNLDARDLENALPAISGSSLTGINTVDEYMYCDGTGGLGAPGANTKIPLSITGQSSGNIFSVNDGNIVCSTAGQYIIEGRTTFHDGKDSSTGYGEVYLKIGTTLNGVETRNTQIAQQYNEGNALYPDRPMGIPGFWDVFTLTGTHYIQLFWDAANFWNSATGQFRFIIKKLG